MASCSTPQWSGDYTPQVTLTVTQQSSTDTQVVLAWTLKYVTHGGYTANTNGNGRDYSVTIDGDSVKTGTFDIDGKSTTTIASGTKTVNKTTSSRNVSFSCSFAFNITWSEVYGGTKTASGSISIPAKTSYTVSYNANGGSGAPSSQTKWHGTTLTLSSTKPTRTGYTFSKWNTKSDGSGTSYSSGANYTANSAATLYAIWTENALTVNYYSNYATEAFADALNTVGASKNVLVHSQSFLYDNDYSTYGLANYSNSTGSIYMTRTGYTGTGNWGTTTSGGTLINENTGYVTGQALAKALGKDLSSGNASISLYAQWSENKLTVNYYSNYADYGTYKGEPLSVSASTNVKVHSQDFLYDNSYSSALSNVQNLDYLYLSRTGYTPTGYWGTSTNGGTLIDEDADYSTGQALAQAFGKSLTSGNASVNVYPQWQINTYTIGYDGNGGYGSMEVQSVNWQETFVLLDNQFKREGYKLVGWNAQREIDRKWYVNGQGWLTEDEITANGYEKKLYANQDELIFDLSWIKGETGIIHQYTMYAIWEISGVVYIDNGITFEPYLAYIDNGTSWDLYLAYVDDGTSWNIIS